MIGYSGAVPVITYTVDDGNGGTDTSTLSLTVDPVPTPRASGIDTDNDGIDDDIDLDDDNDGILDEDEGTFVEGESPITDLVLVLDGSNSVFFFNFLDMLESTASAIEDQSVVPHNGSVRLTVVQFATTARVELAPVIVNGSNIASIAATIRNIEYMDQGSLTHTGIDLAVSELAGLSPVSANQTMVLITDGAPENVTAATTAVTNAQAAGIDTLNVIGIGTEVDDAFNESVVFPQPADDDDGFYVKANTFAAYENALRQVVGTSVPVLVDVDSDGDGTVDRLDLDADNDGISDLTESGQDASVVDTNNDGIVDGTVLANGVPVQANGGQDPADSDGDGRDDFRDLDSDNDGIVDTVEARPTAGYVANDGDVTDNDNDGDGVIDIFDANEGAGTFGGTFIAPVDTDGDGTADFRDLNSDDDGLTDFAESGLTPGADANNDGVGDALGATLGDPDGIVNDPQAVLANEVGDTTEVAYREFTDTDLDGVADTIDLDDDNDGILDTIEDGPIKSAGFFSTVGAPGTNVVDGSSYPITPDTTITYDLAINSGSGTVQTYDAGANGDALRLQASSSSNFAGELDLTFSSSVRNVSFALTDFDNLESYTVNIYDPDGNLYDLSSAGVTSIGSNILQTGNTFSETTDLGNANGNSPSDPFGSVYFNIAGLVSRIEIDFTHSKSSSSVRLLEPTFTVVNDTDSDGIIDSLDLDSDNDGISDLAESTGGTGVALADTNNDGTVSLAESLAAGATGTGDIDGDGLMDIFDADTADISAAASAGTTPIDSDGDGLTDQLDLDRDNDGIADTIEARPTAGYVANDGDVTDNDADGDGVIDIFDANDGTGTFGGTFAAPEDTDGDGTVDYLDTDSDDDALLDSAESGLTPGADANGDGIGDGTGASYADPDGIVNNPQTALANQTGDTTEVGYREVNDPPIPVDPLGPLNLNPTGDAHEVQGFDNELISIDLSEGFSDPNGDPLSFTVDMTGAPAWLTFDPLTNTFTGTPPIDNPGDTAGVTYRHSCYG